jgi:hypothetical protein
MQHIGNVLASGMQCHNLPYALATISLAQRKYHTAANAQQLFR